jgi:hypothetical protein
MRRAQILPQQRIIGQSFCEFCRAEMWLACIEPEKPDHAISAPLNGQCPMCTNFTVKVVKYRSSKSESDLEIKLISSRP